MLAVRFPDEAAVLTSLVEVLWTARYDYRPHWKLERHKHRFFQMIYFLSGEGRFFLDDREYSVIPDEVFLIKPGQVHGLSASSEVRTLDIKFVVHDPRLRRLLLESSSFALKKDSDLLLLFEQIRWEGERKATLFRELCRAYLAQMLIVYIRRDRGAMREDESLVAAKGAIPTEDSLSRKTIEMIQARYAEDLDEQQIARALGVSDRHFRQRFKESMGMPPKRYLVQYRMERAKDLISHSDYPLKAVAELAGFKGVHYFTRVFRQITGESPGAWRRKYHDGICKDVCISPRFSNVILVRKESPEEKAAG